MLLANHAGMPCSVQPPRVAVVLCTLLAGCVDDTGTYCRHDYQCISNSCTLYSCDDPLVVAIVPGGKDDEDDDEREKPEPAHSSPPSAAAKCPWLCEVLTSEFGCSQAAGCHVAWECTRPWPCSSGECLNASCGSMDPDHCQAPCQRTVRCSGKREC